MSNTYPRKLTKEELIKYGVKEITKDCTVTFEDGRVLEKEEDFLKDKISGYFRFSEYELDENGNRIKIPTKTRYKEKVYNTYKYKSRPIYLHRAMVAWFHNEIPEGLVIDHISNKHDTLYDNRLENLQLTTQGENSIKDQVFSNRELKCKMSLPLSYYEDKLNTYLNKRKNAKDRKEKHTLGVFISQYRARIRYWKSHEEEYLKNEEAKAIEAQARKARNERTKDLKQYQKLIDEARELYKQNPSSDNNYNWRLAVNNYNEFVKNNPYKTQKQLFAEFNDEQVLN